MVAGLTEQAHGLSSALGHTTRVAPDGTRAARAYRSRFEPGEEVPKQLVPEERR
jgi:hypothetical protein